MQSFGIEVVETARLMRREFDRRAGSLGVTRAQWRVLVRVERTNGVRQVELADALDMEPITLCRIIDRLEESGLVERRRDEVDRRAWNIHLLPKAQPVLEELHGVGEGLHADALAGISQADRAKTLAVLARIRDNLARLGTSCARKAS